MDESSPLAQIARFGDWRNVKNFEMAYLPGRGDYLEWSLGPNYRPGPYAVPYSGSDGNGIDGRLYGTNNIAIVDTMACSPAVGVCGASRAPTPL